MTPTAHDGAAPLPPLPRLPAGLATAHHLLLLASDVGEEELPMLVHSLVAGAAWQVPAAPGLPGVIDLLAGEAANGSAPHRATLTGPWRVDLRTRHDLDLPPWVSSAWVLDVPPERSGPAPDVPGGHGELLDAFGPEHPDGVELQCLDVLLACARRLAGALRLTSGALVEPDPASAVDLTLHSPVWLSPEALHHVLAEVLPGIEVLPGVAALGEAAQQLDGYGAIWRPTNSHTVGHAGGPAEDAVLVEVEAAEVLPAALAHASWTAGGVISYRLRWLGTPADRRPTTRAGTRRREEARTAIEDAAAALHAAAGGEILDEDDLVVEVDQLGTDD